MEGRLTNYIDIFFPKIVRHPTPSALHKSRTCQALMFLFLFVCSICLYKHRKIELRLNISSNMIKRTDNTTHMYTANKNSLMQVTYNPWQDQILPLV